MHVFVLDANQKSSLATIRSLAKKNIDVISGSTNKFPYSISTKYSSHYYNYPSPVYNPDLFIDYLDKVFSHYDKLIVFPMTDITMSELLRKIHCFPSNISIPFSDYNTYNTLSNKVSLFKIASKLDISIPWTLSFSNSEEFKEFCNVRELVFPAVLKPCLSRIYLNNRWLKTSIKYVYSIAELYSCLDQEPFTSYPFLIQERIVGPGVGVFLLTQKGKVLAQFAHQRIREKPPSGGVSVVCESIAPPKEALDASIRLFEHVGWSGVGMVEFKMDERDGRPKLMEVNARFWGSLQLAINAGVDFPYLLYKMAIGEEIKGPEKYKTGIRCRWELGDLDHLLIRLRNNSNKLSLPSNAPSKASVLKDFCLDFFRPSVKNEIFQWHDPRPFFCELREYVKNLRSKK